MRPFRQILEDAKFSPVKAGTGLGSLSGSTCDGRFVIFGAQVSDLSYRILPYCTMPYCTVIYF